MPRNIAVGRNLAVGRSLAIGRSLAVGRILVSYIGVLDLVPGAAAGYSVARRLSGAYTGPLVRLREGAGNTESDFYPLENGGLNTAAVTAFLAGASGFVTKLYDQGGSGLNAVQTVTARQPQYVASVTNSKPGALFDGTDDELTLSLTLTNETIVTASNRSANGGATNGHILAQSTAYRIRYSTVASRIDLTYNSGASLVFTGKDQTLFHVIAEWYDGTTQFGSVDNGASASGVRTAASHTFSRIGSRGATEFLNGNFLELLAYGSALSDALRQVAIRDVGGFFAVSVA